MSATTHACLAVTSKKEVTGENESFIRRFLPSCSMLLLAALLSSNPSHANILTTLTATEAVITQNAVRYEITDYACGGYTFNFAYLQRMIINNQTVMVSTEFVYDHGTYTLTLIAECGGYNIYGLGSCACLTTDFKIPFPDFETATGPTVAVETLSVATPLPEAIPAITEAIPAGALWIRKK